MPDTSSLARYVRVLKAFTSEAPDLTAVEVSAAAGIPLATTYRYLAELRRVGLVEPGSAKGSYRTSPALWELGYRTSRVSNLRRLALPYLQDLQAIVQQNTQLLVLQDTEVLYLESLSARNAVRNVTDVAGRMPARINSSGLLMAAFLDNDEHLNRIRYADISGYRLLTDKTANAQVHAPSVEEVEMAMKNARSQDFCRLDGWLVPGISGLSAPIRDRRGQVVAAVSLIIPTDNSLLERSLPALRATAMGISRALGWSGRTRR